MKIIPSLTTELKSNSLDRRLTNIEFITRIPRNGLSFESHQKQLFFSNFYPGEFVTIQYPGKESASTSRIIKPYDFRPKLQLPNGSYISDLSFNDIWDSLFTLFHESSNNEFIIKLLCCEFYRIAFMLDYNFMDEHTTFKCLDIPTNTVEIYKSYSGIYTYCPNSNIIEYLKEISPTILGASWESFFMYNDLLALNEDCKYFYNAYSLENSYDDAVKYIKKGTGRINTMLTHIHVLSVILGESKLTKLLQSFARQRGVAPLSNKDLNNFLNDYMY